MKFRFITIAFTLGAISACARSATTPQAPHADASRAPSAASSSSAAPARSAAPVASPAPAPATSAAPEPAADSVVDVSDGYAGDLLGRENPRASPKVEAELAEWEKTYE